MIRSPSVKIVTPVALTALLAACAERPEPPDPSARIFELADRYVDAYFEVFPEEATYLGVPEAPHDRLPDLSATAREDWQATADSILAELEQLDVSGLAPGHPAAITHGFLATVLRDARRYRVCRLELWNVSPTWTGWPSRIGRLASAQPVETDAEQQVALRRFGELPRFLDQEVANLREGLERGHSAPRNNVRAVIRQVDALLTAPPAESPFVSMAPEGADPFRAALVELEAETIRPALRRYRDFLEQEYLEAAREAIGVAANPEGEACYAAAVRYWATVEVPAAEIHRIGLEQMAAIRTEMREIAERSFDTADVDALLERLRTDPEHLVGSREAMLRIAREAVERAEAAVADWFGRLPRAAVEVRPVPAFEEEGAPFAYYSSPAEDGSRPGIYFINLHQAETKPRAGVEATTFHEAYPGHHLQIALAMEREGLHPVQRYIYLSGFGEGWALYTERLTDEMGLYSGDVDRMGLLSNEALRAARLVVDSGMHVLGWSRDEAIDYMLANTAEARSTVTSEVDRYLAAPGQATAYLLGSMEILRLREQAREALGEGFDIRAFHDRVLEDGAVPLDMLRAKIERWLAGDATGAEEESPADAFWANLREHCGYAYSGGLSLEPPGDEMLTGTEELLVHFRECSDEELRLPFHIEIEETGEWDRSRTWVFRRRADGLELRHDHRRPDGTPDEVTWYGGHSTPPGTPSRQEFLSVERTEELGYERGWRIEIVPGERYTYGTTRRGEWSWRVDFDLTRPVPAPPPPWGFQEQAPPAR